MFEPVGEILSITVAGPPYRKEFRLLLGFSRVDLQYFSCA
jgi:hypothetical protein